MFTCTVGENFFRKYFSTSFAVVSQSTSEEGGATISTGMLPPKSGFSQLGPPLRPDSLESAFRAAHSSTTTEKGAGVDVDFTILSLPCGCGPGLAGH